MTTTMITPPQRRIEIDIIRHNGFYFYNRRENGRIVADAERISCERAQGIIEANKDEDTYHTGQIRFDNGSYEFSWTVRLIEEEKNVCTN